MRFAFGTRDAYRGPGVPHRTLWVHRCTMSRSSHSHLRAQTHLSVSSGCCTASARAPSPLDDLVQEPATPQGCALNHSLSPCERRPGRAITSLAFVRLDLLCLHSEQFQLYDRLIRSLISILSRSSCTSLFRSSLSIARAWHL